MKKLKKVISSVLLISMLPIFSVHAENNIFYTESYENIVTNDVPEEFEFYADNLHIVERIKDREKAAEMTSSDGEITVERAFETYGNDIVIQFDTALWGNTCDGEIQIKNNSGKYLPLLIINESEIVTHDGKEITVLTESYKNISIHFDIREKRYDVYINGKSVVSKWYMSNIPDSVAGFKLSLSSSDEGDFSFGFDNLSVFSGTGYKDVLKRPDYNEDSIEFVPQNSDTEIVTPLVNTAFEQGYGITGLSVAKGENVIENVKEEDGNGYVRIERTTETDCYIDIPTDNPPKNIVIEFDIKGSKDFNGSVIARGENATFNHLITFNPNGTLSVGSGKTIGKCDDSKWTRVQMIMNFKKHTITAYTDGKLTAENVPMAISTDDIVGRFRIGAFGGIGVLKLDNLLIYQGKSLKTFEPKDPTERTLIFEADSVAEELIGEGIAIHIGSGTIFYNGKKEFLDSPAFIENNSTYVPVRAICEALGLEVFWDAENKKVTVGNKFEFIVGDTEVKAGEEKILLDNGAKLSGNRVFLPLRNLCEKLLGKRVFWNDRGLILINDTSYKFTEKQLLSVHDYMAYDRPTFEEFDKLYRETAEGVHPRIMATQSDFDRIKTLYNSGNKTIVEWVNALKKSGEQMLNAALPERTDDPERYALSAPQTLLTRVPNLALLYKLTGEQKYADKILKDITVVCNEFVDWYHVEKYLAVGEMTAVVAIAYDWLYDHWTPEQRKMMEDAIYSKSLEFADKTYYGQLGAWVNYPILANNWNFVCSGGTVLGAAAVYDTNPEFCADVIINSMRSMELPSKNYYPDGAWIEGTGYWLYATSYFTRALATLETMTGTDFNMSKAPGFSKTGRYAILTQGPNGTLGFHDGGRTITIPMCNMYLASKFNDPGLGADLIHSMKKAGTAPEAMHILWYRESFEAPDADLPADSFYDGTTSVAVMRERWNDNEATFFGYHLDKGNVDHGHIDSGSFIIDMWGECFAADLGANTYTHTGYFTTDRSKFYKVRPEGHNVVVINPDSEVGQQSSKNISVIENVSKINGAYSVADLTDTYSDDVKDYKRGYMLYNDRRTVLVRDEIVMKEPGEMYWFMHTKAGIDIIDNNTAMLTLNGKTVRLDFTTNADEYELRVMDAVPLPTSPTPAQQDLTAGYQKIAIYLKGSGKVNINVRIMRTDDPMYDEPIYDEDIKDWEIKESEIIKIPLLSSISADGKELTGFMSDDTSYELDVAKGSSMPVITATTEDYADISIVNAEKVTDTTIITVSSKIDPRYKKIYKIDYNSVVTPAGLNKFNVAGITSSYLVQDDYIVENVIDGSAGTWWAAEGNGEHMIMDLGSVKTIDVIGVDMLYGLRRKTYYSIEVSENGTDWKEIFNGSNSQKTDDMEYLDTEGTNARYIKLTAFGNSEGSKWISLAEVEVYGK